MTEKYRYLGPVPPSEGLPPSDDKGPEYRRLGPLEPGQGIPEVPPERYRYLGPVDHDSQSQSGGLSPEDNQKAAEIHGEKLQAEEDLKKASTDLVMNEKNREYSRQVLPKGVAPNLRTETEYDEKSDEAGERIQDAMTRSSDATAEGADHFSKNQAGYVEQAKSEAESDGKEINLESSETPDQP